MGLFDAIKKAFDTGGIKVALDAPKTFAWSDAAIPVTVTLTGHKTEPRTVTALEFQLEEDEKNIGEPGNSRIGNSSTHDGRLTYRRTEKIELQPLQVVTVEVQVPLNKDAVASKGLVSEKVLDALVFSGTIKTSSPDFKLSVFTDVEGAAASKGTSQNIRNSDVKFSSSISFT